MGGSAEKRSFEYDDLMVSVLFSQVGAACRLLSTTSTSGIAILIRASDNESIKKRNPIRPRAAASWLFPAVACGPSGHLDGYLETNRPVHLDIWAPLWARRQSKTM